MKTGEIEVIVDEILDIADDTSRDITTDANGKTVYDHEHINRSRLRIDTRKWLAAKLAPRIYGDKISMENDRENMEMIIQKVEDAKKAYGRDY